MRVRDLEAMITFYRDTIGLELLERTGDGATMGVDGAALLHLLHRPGAPYGDPREAGLFHIAFLMPNRTGFARWNSARASRRNDESTGLDWFSLHVEDEAVLAAQAARLGVARPKSGPVEARDPWGMQVRLIKT